MGSRSLQLGGSAVVESAAGSSTAREAAAELLEANADDVVLDRDRGRFHVAGTPAVVRSWAEVARRPPPRAGRRVGGRRDFQADSPTFPFGAHVAVVEVDTETGEVDLLSRSSPPTTAAGSSTRCSPRASATAASPKASARRSTRSSATTPTATRTGNLADYAMVSAAELPRFELVTMETPTPVNPLGAKGIGESGTIGATPAVQSAVCDALAHLGVRHIDLPCTPERVWRAIQRRYWVTVRVSAMWSRIAGSSSIGQLGRASPRCRTGRPELPPTWV